MNIKTLMRMSSYFLSTLPAVYSNQLRHLEGSALWGIDCLLILLYMRNGFFMQSAVRAKLKHYICNTIYTLSYNLPTKSCHKPRPVSDLQKSK